MPNYIIFFVGVAIPSIFTMIMFPNDPKAFGMGLFIFLLGALITYGIKNFDNPKIRKIFYDFF